jgi:subtilisin family serine protease
VSVRSFAVLVGLLLAPLALASAGTRSLESAAPWWTSTMMDADHDGLDDALAPILGVHALQTVIVDYAQMPTDDERAVLEQAGYLVTLAPENFPMLVVKAPGDRVGEILHLPGVVFVEANDVIYPLLKDSVPLIGAPQVWKTYGATGKGIVVAVLDDGAFEQHPDLSPKLAGSYNAGAPTTPLGGTIPQSESVTPAGENGHGTHVAGTIVGGGDQSGGTYKGVAPEAKFVDIRVFSGPNQTSSDIVLKGLDWSLSHRDSLHIRVASLSLGGRTSDGKDALSRAVNIAVDKGLVVVAAAGNAGPAFKTVTSPGAAEKAITVGAVDKQKHIASYSSRGPTLDGRTKPDLVAPGSSITSTIPPFAKSPNDALGGSREVFYGSLSGTSMAAPHVSGVVALMLQVNPDLTPFQVKQILLATAQDIDSVKGADNTTGYGFVNAIAAAQVAHDPTLLQSAQFRSILATIPEPQQESFLDQATFQMQALVRDGGPMLYGSAAALVAAVVIFAYVLLRR